MAKLISKTYGDALFNLAIERGTMDTLMEEAVAVRDSMASNKELFKFLNNPGIESDEKEKVVENVYSRFVSRDMVGFIHTIVEKGRHNEIVAIMNYFIDAVKEFKKIGVVYVTTPIALSDDEKKKIYDRVLATTDYVTLEIDYTIDESLIGGMIIRIKDKVVDSSIKTKLSNIRKELLEVQLT